MTRNQRRRAVRRGRAITRAEQAVLRQLDDYMQADYRFLKTGSLERERALNEAVLERRRLMRALRAAKAMVV